MVVSGQVSVNLVDHLGLNSLHVGILNCHVRPNILSVRPSVGPVTGWMLSIFGSNLFSPMHAVFNTTENSRPIDVVNSNLAYLFVPGISPSDEISYISVSISFQQFSLVMFPVPILEYTLPAKIISSSTHHVIAVMHSLFHASNRSIRCLFGLQDSSGFFVGSSQVNCSVPVLSRGTLEFRISFDGLISTPISLEIGACETIVDVYPQRVHVNSRVIVNVGLNFSLKSSVSVCFGESLIDCFAKENNVYTCLTGPFTFPQNLTISICHQRCESKQKFELRVLATSNFRANPSLVQAAGGTLITILGEMLEHDSVLYCRFAGKMISMHNATCLSAELPPGSNQFSIVKNAEEVIGSVSIFAIPNKITSFSSSLLFSNKNHSLFVHISHPLSGSQFYLDLGLNTFHCNPATYLESGYTSFLCLVQTTGPGLSPVKLCGTYCTSESELSVEEPPVFTMSNEGCVVGQCVINVFGNQLCHSFNIFSSQERSHCTFIMGDSMINSTSLHHMAASCVFHPKFPGNATVSLRCGNTSFYDTVVHVQGEWSLHPKFVLVGFFGIPQNVSFVGTSVLQTNFCRFKNNVFTFVAINNTQGYCSDVMLPASGVLEVCNSWKCLKFDYSVAPPVTSIALSTSLAFTSGGSKIYLPEDLVKTHALNNCQFRQVKSLISEDQSGFYCVSPSLHVGAVYVDLFQTENHIFFLRQL